MPRYSTIVVELLSDVKAMSTMGGLLVLSDVLGITRFNCLIAVSYHIKYYLYLTMKSRNGRYATWIVPRAKRPMVDTII